MSGVLVAGAPQPGQTSAASEIFLPHSQQLISAILAGVSFPFSFQFCTRLAAVYAEEVGGFGVFNSYSKI